MSETLLIALLGFLGAILGAIIGAAGSAAFGSRESESGSDKRGCATKIFVAAITSAALTIGFVIAGAFILQNGTLRTTVLQPDAADETNVDAAASVPTLPVIEVTPNAVVPTPTPISIGTIVVPGNSSEGLRFTSNQPGLYIFRYVEGAYSTYPTDRIPSGQATWLTAIRVFKNRPVEWKGIAISDLADYRVVDYAYFYSQSEAEAAAEGGSLTLSLLQGDYLMLVAVDGRPYYSDNPGGVSFEVLFISE